jgi:hypothetical protein
MGRNISTHTCSSAAKDTDRCPWAKQPLPAKSGRWAHTDQKATHATQVGDACFTSGVCRSTHSCAALCVAAWTPAHAHITKTLFKDRNMHGAIWQTFGSQPHDSYTVSTHMLQRSTKWPSVLRVSCTTQQLDMQSWQLTCNVAQDQVSTAIGLAAKPSCFTSVNRHRCTTLYPAPTRCTSPD